MQQHSAVEAEHRPAGALGLAVRVTINLRQAGSEAETSSDNDAVRQR